MSTKKWKIGFSVAILFGLLSAGSGLAAGINWQEFVAVLCTSLLTNLAAYMMRHPVESIDVSQSKKPQVPLMTLGLAALILSGCGSTPEERFDSAVATVQGVAFNATAIALDEHPDWKPHFSQAVQDLKLLEQSESPQMASIIAIIARLPASKLESLTGKLLIGNGTLILYRYERKIDLSNENKRELIRALIAGIETGSL